MQKIRALKRPALHPSCPRFHGDLSLNAWFPEEGLASAQRCTDVLYHENVEVLARMREDELFHVVGAAPTVRAVLHPDTTVWDACLAAKCYRNKSEFVARTLPSCPAQPAVPASVPCAPEFSSRAENIGGHF